MKTDGDARAGADVGMEGGEGTDGELAAEPGGGSAEATGVEVEVDSAADPGPVTVPTVRVKLAVTI